MDTARKRKKPAKRSVLMRPSWMLPRVLVTQVQVAAAAKQVWVEKLVEELLTKGLKEDC